MWFQVKVLSSRYLVYMPLKFWKACVVNLEKIGPYMDGDV